MTFTGVHATIGAIDYYLPHDTLTTSGLASIFPDWNVERLDSKTGFHSRHIAQPDECASDLAFNAADRLLVSGACARSEIDFLIVCTQSPDYLLPTTACLLQHRLGLSQQCGALDVNLGCSGYVYCLGLAEGLINTRQARSILLITTDVYSRYVGFADRTTRPIFADGASATYLTSAETSVASLGPSVYGTDGSGAEHLILRNSGLRMRAPEVGVNDNSFRKDSLHMNGGEVFKFAVRVVPHCVQSLLMKAKCSVSDVDLFVFHQANNYVLAELRKLLLIPLEKFYVSHDGSGNTISSTIPIALKNAQTEERLLPGMRIMLIGFGVGFSWGATLVRWTASVPLRLF